MAVRDMDGELAEAGFDPDPVIGVIRPADLDARQVARKADADIDREPLAPLGRSEAVEAQIHADLAGPAERQQDELVRPARHSDVLPVAPSRAATPRRRRR